MNTAWKIVNFAMILALCVVLLGAWTRINNAGLSCPDWPGCFGHMVLPDDPAVLEQAQTAFPDTPIETGKTQLEMWHRYLAGALGVVIAVQALLAYQLRNIKGFPVKESGGLLLLVIVQALFGMWTVTLKLYPPVVTLHLLGGVMTLTLLFLIRIKIRRLIGGDSSLQASGGLALIKCSILVLLLQIVLGGWTSSNYAGPACAHWFSCNPSSNIQPDFIQAYDPTAVIGPNYEGGLLPVEARSAIHIGHRLGAGAVVIMTMLLVISLFHARALRKPLICLVSLVLMQLLLGVVNVVYAVPVLLAMLHHALAIGLLLTMLWLYSLMWVKEGVAYE